MDDITAQDRLHQEFGIDEFNLELPSFWQDELDWERKWIKDRHKGTRGQYQLAVTNTYERLRDWLRTGRLLPGVLEDHFLGGVELSPEKLAATLARWVGQSRRAAVWCSLWWVKMKLEERDNQ